MITSVCGWLGTAWPRSATTESPRWRTASKVSSSSCQIYGRACQPASNGNPSSSLTFNRPASDPVKETPRFVRLADLVIRDDWFGRLFLFQIDEDVNEEREVCQLATEPTHHSKLDPKSLNVRLFTRQRRRWNDGWDTPTQSICFPYLLIYLFILDFLSRLMNCALNWTCGIWTVKASGRSSSRGWRSPWRRKRKGSARSRRTSPRSRTKNPVRNRWLRRMRAGGWTLRPPRKSSSIRRAPPKEANSTALSSVSPSFWITGPKILRWSLTLFGTLGRGLLAGSD